MHLNPNKCNFCITSGRLLGFIFSTTWIIVDPLKVEAIVWFPPLCTIPQLQSLQGKENFLRCFITNYVNITKGFIYLLNKDVPFHWDEASQCSFEALKCTLMFAPLLRPPNYNKDFLLYFSATEWTIDMVLVQENNLLEEHVIYYLNRGMVGQELNYSHVGKLALAAIQVVQRFRHYILFCKTTIIAIVNLFEYLLTRCVVEGKISRCIVIL